MPSTDNFNWDLITGGSDYPRSDGYPDQPQDAKDINDLAKQIDTDLGILIITSGTRPSSPKKKQAAFETDTQKVILYNGSQWLDIVDPQDFSSGGTQAQRDALWGVPLVDSERVALANKGVRWHNTDKQWDEAYFVPQDMVGRTVPGLVVGTPAGWYPVGGLLPYADLSFASTAAGWSETTLGVTFPYTEVSDRLTWHDPSTNPANIKPTFAGRYRVTLTMTWGVVGAYDKFLRAYKNGAATGFGISTNEQLGGSIQAGSFCLDLNGTTDYIYINGFGSSVTTTMNATVLVEYIGPRLA